MSRMIWPALAASVLVAGGCKSEEKQGEAAGAEGAAAVRSAPAEAEAPLVVYSGRGEPLIAPALAAFEEASDLDLEVKYGDTAQLAATLLEEGSRSPADLFLAQDASTLAFLEDKDLFAELDRELLGRVPEGFRSPSGRWVALSGRARVLAYNVDEVAEDDLPETIDALTRPEWKGRVGWAPENASFQSFVAAMIKLRGRDKAREWLEAMKANQPKDYPKNTPAVIAVSRGEIDVALVNHYYLYRLKEEHGEGFPVANHYFRTEDAAALVNLSGAALIKSSKRGAPARELLEYLLGAEGQRHFVEGNYEFPVADGAASPIGLPSAESLKAPALDPAELENLEQTVKLLRETGVLR